MRKTVLALVILMFTVPAMAGVNIIAEGQGDGWVAIKYTTDVNVSAFALDVTVDGDGTFIDVDSFFDKGECNGTDKGYGIFPANFHRYINASDPNWEFPGYTPVADVCDLPGDTLAGFGTNGATIEMGALYEDGNQPVLSGTLCRLRVASSRIWGFPNDCNVSVVANVGRGKVVLEDTNSVDPNVLQATLVAIRTHKACTYYDVNDVSVPVYAPFQHFLDGDIRGGPGTQFKPDGKVDSKDLNIVIKAENWGLNTTVNGGTADECADMRGGPGFQFKPDGVVDSKDLNIVIKSDNWGCPGSVGCAW